jgi:hypothetical protein
MPHVKPRSNAMVSHSTLIALEEIWMIQAATSRKRMAFLTAAHRSSDPMGLLPGAAQGR